MRKNQKAYPALDGYGKEEMYHAIELWQESGLTQVKFCSLLKRIKNRGFTKTKASFQTTLDSGENHTWFGLESHVVLIETTLGFGSNHTWFEVKPRVVFYFIQNQPVIFLKPASFSADKIWVPGR